MVSSRIFAEMSVIPLLDQDQAHSVVNEFNRLVEAKPAHPACGSADARPPHSAGPRALSSASLLLMQQTSKAVADTGEFWLPLLECVLGKRQRTLEFSLRLSDVLLALSKVGK
jgi:hypothetical protein